MEEVKLRGIVDNPAASLVRASLCSVYLLLVNNIHAAIHRKNYTALHTFNGPFSGTTRASQYQKCETNLDFTEVRDSEWQWQWHQLGPSAPHPQFFTDRMPFLPPNQQCQQWERRWMCSFCPLYSLNSPEWYLLVDYWRNSLAAQNWKWQVCLSMTCILPTLCQSVLVCDRSICCLHWRSTLTIVLTNLMHS